MPAITSKGYLLCYVGQITLTQLWLWLLGGGGHTRLAGGRAREAAPAGSGDARTVADS